MIYPAAEFVLGRAVFCAACSKPTIVAEYNRESGLVKTKCRCDKGPHFQNLLQQPATAGVGA